VKLICVFLLSLLFDICVDDFSRSPFEKHLTDVGFRVNLYKYESTGYGDEGDEFKDDIGMQGEEYSFQIRKAIIRYDPSFNSLYLDVKVSKYYLPLFVTITWWIFRKKDLRSSSISTLSEMSNKFIAEFVHQVPCFMKRYHKIKPNMSRSSLIKAWRILLWSLSLSKLLKQYFLNWLPLLNIENSIHQSRWVDSLVLILTFWWQWNVMSHPTSHSCLYFVPSEYNVKFYLKLIALLGFWWRGVSLFIQVIGKCSSPVGSSSQPVPIHLFPWTNYQSKENCWSTEITTITK